MKKLSDGHASEDGLWQVSRRKIRGRPGWILERPVEPRDNGENDEAGLVVTAAHIVGWRSDFVLPLLVDIARRIGIRPNTLSKTDTPFSIPEEEAYRLALAFQLTRRTRSITRVEAIIEAIRGFQAEETYLWYSYLHEAMMNGRETRLAGSMAQLGQAIR